MQRSMNEQEKHDITCAYKQVIAPSNTTCKQSGNACITLAPLRIHNRMPARWAQVHAASQQHVKQLGSFRKHACEYM